MMKILDRISVLLFNLCLLFAAIITPALILASSPEYYHSRFEKNGLYGELSEEGEIVGKKIHYIGGNRYQSAVFTREQLDGIAEHTIEYLFGDKESFALKLDNVYMNDSEYRDGVNIFSDTAVLHMADVKLLMRTALVGAVICAVIAAALLVMFILRRQRIGAIALKYTLIFYAAIFGFAFVFCLVTFIGSGANDFLFDLWGNIHYLLFPFQPEKIANSFFNDTLTEILNLDLFITAVVIVVSVVSVLLALWFMGAVLLRRASRKAKK